MLKNKAKVQGPCQEVFTVGQGGSVSAIPRCFVFSAQTSGAAKIFKGENATNFFFLVIFKHQGQCPSLPGFMALT